MAENTKIQWATHTFNPWRGCTKVAAGCANCYADQQSKRNPKTLGVWGPSGTRVVASEAMWREPVKWNRDARCRCGPRYGDRKCAWCRLGCHRPRVFCASLADVFEDWGGVVSDSRGNAVSASNWKAIEAEGPAPAKLDDVRARLFRLIDATRNLDWLLLTKRPENVRRMIGDASDRPKVGTCTQDDRPTPRRGNLWLGTSIACQADADRNIPELLECRDLAAKLFLSIEPLVGPVNLRNIRPLNRRDPCSTDAFTGVTSWPDGDVDGERGVDWVIVGGESGPNARPCDIDWIASIVRQCRGAGVPVFVKQLGARCVKERAGGDAANTAYHPHGWVSQVGTAHHAGWFKFSDKKGGDPAEWPEDIRVREVPA